MQDLISVARKKATGFCLFLVVMIFTTILIGCENPGSVGGSYTDPGTEVRDTVFSVSDVQTDSFATFSGRLSFFSAGQFNDPLFGDITATSLLKPTLPNTGVSDSMESGSNMDLRLIVDSTATSNIYGDTLSTAEFDLIEVDQIWRSRAWKLNDEIALSQNTIGSFTIDEATDTVDVPLASEWVSRYRAFYNAISSNRDSLYVYDFHGLAVVPRNNSKITPFDPSITRFQIVSPDNDTSQVSTSHWAFSLDRTNATPPPAGSSKAISTFEKVLKFDLNLSREDLGTANISKVELVFYQNNDALESSLSGSAKRPEVNNVSLYLSRPQNMPEAISTGNPIAQANYDEDEEAFRFDISQFTNSVLVDGIAEENSFYITIQSNNGIIASSLLHNDEAPEAKRPKMIVTYINTKDN